MQNQQLPLCPHHLARHSSIAQPRDIVKIKPQDKRVKMSRHTISNMEPLQRAGNVQNSPDTEPCLAYGCTLSNHIGLHLLFRPTYLTYRIEQHSTVLFWEMAPGIDSIQFSLCVQVAL